MEYLDTLKSRVPDHLKHLVDKIARGSKAAAIKLHCLQCVGYDKKEVTKCTGQNMCPMWKFRPYQEKP